MQIGFSTGCLYKTHARLAPTTFDVFRKLGCTAIELMCQSPELISEIELLTLDDLRGFEHISIHLPKCDFGRTNEASRFLSRMESVHEKLGFSVAVLHPNEISDWSFLRKTTLPIAIENMDAGKKSCKTVEDMQKVFESIDVKMIFDVAHVFDNDPTMQLGKSLVAAFSERICEIHVSGYNYRELHDPIHLSRQNEILDIIPSTSLPIIIESCCLNEDEVKKEFDYISSYLQEK